MLTVHALLRPSTRLADRKTSSSSSSAARPLKRRGTSRSSTSASRRGRGSWAAWARQGRSRAGRGSCSAGRACTIRAGAALSARLTRRCGNVIADRAHDAAQLPRDGARRGVRLRPLVRRRSANSPTLCIHLFLCPSSHECYCGRAPCSAAATAAATRQLRAQPRSREPQRGRAGGQRDRAGRRRGEGWTEGRVGPGEGAGRGGEVDVSCWRVRLQGRRRSGSMGGYPHSVPFCCVKSFTSIVDERKQARKAELRYDPAPPFVGPTLPRRLRSLPTTPLDPHV